MKQQIKTLFQTRSEIPLFYIESGSRLWGIASPDSDFDVRGFHLKSKAEYFDFRKTRDLIEIMDGDFDFVSYDLDKMFGLLAKSNPTVFEWIRAHIVYWNVLPDFDSFQKQLIENIDYQKLFHHYLSLSKGQMKLIETDRLFTYKKVFYSIRGLLSADLASRRTMPELLIDRLFDQFETENDCLKIARECLDRKKRQAEKQEVEPENRAMILNALNRFQSELSGREVQKGDRQTELENTLRDYCQQLKTTFYQS